MRNGILHAAKEKSKGKQVTLRRTLPFTHTTLHRGYDCYGHDPALLSGDLRQVLFISSDNIENLKAEYPEAMWNPDRLPAQMASGSTCQKTTPCAGQVEATYDFSYS